MKMMKTLAAFAFAMGIMFVGNMDAQAYTSYGTEFDSSCMGNCHIVEEATPGESDTVKSLPGAVPNTDDHNANGPASCSGSAGCHGPILDTTHEGGTAGKEAYKNCQSCHGDADLDGYSVAEENVAGLGDGVTTAPNAAPVAHDDSATVTEGESVTVDVLANDTDADAGATLDVTAVTTPASGTAVINADNTITYTAGANAGTVTFDYTVSDGTDSDTGTVTVTVEAAPVNTPPVAGVNDFTMNEDTVLNGQLVATDVDTADTLTYALGTTAPTNGTAVVNANGTFTYTPDANFEGTDLFTFTVSDGTNTVTGTVNVTVTDVAETDVPNQDLPFMQDTDKDGIMDDVDAYPYDFDNDGIADVDDEFPTDPTNGFTGLKPSTPPTEETPESTNPKTGGTAGLMLSAGATVMAAAGMVVLRKKN